MATRKSIVIAALLCVLSLTVTGCWDRIELEDQHFVLAMGIDRRPGGGYVVSVQLAKANVIAGGEGDSGTSAGGHVVSIEGDSLVGCLTALETVSNRRLNVAHIKGVFIGEDLARDGIGSVLSSLTRFPQSRRSLYIVIVRGGEAQEFLRHLHPMIESNPGKYIEEMLASHTFTGLLPRSQLHNIVGDIEMPSRDALVAVGAVNKTLLNEPYLQPGDEPLPADANVYAGEHRFVGAAVPLEFNGSAMFSGDKLVGFLTGAETRLALMLRGEFRRGPIAFSEPDRDARVVLDVRRGRNTQVTAAWSDGDPEIAVRVRLEAEIIEITSETDWGDPPKSAELDEAVSAYLDDMATEVIRKAQAAGADIFGFGDALRPAFATYNDFASYNWLGRFPDVTVTPDVQLTVRRTGLLLSPSAPVDGEQPAESLDGWHITPGPRVPVPEREDDDR